MKDFGQRISCAFCLEVFVICHSCYRGQKYCSVPCRSTFKRQRRNEASRRYQDSDVGRRRHTLRQNALRLRQRNVTHPSSQTSLEIVEQNAVKPPRVRGEFQRCCICRTIIRFLLNEPSSRPRTDQRRKKRRVRDRYRNKGQDPPAIFR